MKKPALLVAASFYCMAAFSQFEFNGRIGGGVFSARDVSGRPLFKQYDGDIDGSPYLNDNWENAALTLSRGKTVSPVMIKMNIERNELNYKDSAGKEFIIDAWQVKKIEYLSYYTKDSIRYVFKNGYPAIHKQDTNSYYQVYAAGKIELLAKRVKYIRTDRDDYSGTVTKEFLDAAVVFYVFTKNTIEEFRPYKSLVLTIMRDKEKAISNYMDENKINLKKTTDLVKLFNYYSSL